MVTSIAQSAHAPPSRARARTEPLHNEATGCCIENIDAPASVLHDIVAGNVALLELNEKENGMQSFRHNMFVPAVARCTALLVACAVITSARAAPGDKVVLKLGHVLAADSHYQLTAVEFARRLQQKTNGKLEVQIFPQSQLGAEVQMTQALRTGTQDMMICSEAPIENTIKEWQVLSLPFLFENVDDGNRILQGPVGKKLLDMMTPHNMIGLAWLSVLERDVFTVKKPIASLTDMKGLTIRVMQSPGYIHGYRALGANPTPLAYNQLYLALQQGVVDAAETSPDQMVQDKFTEVAKHFYLTHVNYVPVVLAISKAAWNRLTPDLQKAVREAATEAARFDLTEYKRLYSESLALFKTKGIEVKDVDLKPWRAATEPATRELLAAIPSGPALYNDIVASKHGG